MDANRSVLLNMTSSNNTITTFMEFWIEWKISFVISWIELILITLLNLFLIILLLRRKTKSRMSFFVLNLAISDLSVGIFYLLPDIIQRTTGVWLSGMGGIGEEITCIIYQYLSHAVVYASSYMLVVLSIDRLYVIACPLTSAKRGHVYKYSMVLSAWIIAAGLALPQPIKGATLTRIGKKIFCDLDYSSVIFMKIFVTLFVFAAVIIPIIIIIVCYLWIIWIIWSRRKSGLFLSKKKTYNNIDSSEGNPTPESRIMSRARKRSIEMSCVVVAAFFLCWAPFSLHILLGIYGLIGESTGYHFIMMALAPLNSAANPMVFTIFNYNMFCTSSTSDNRHTHSTATIHTTLLRTSKQSKRKGKENGLQMTNMISSNRSQFL